MCAIVSRLGLVVSFGLIAFFQSEDVTRLKVGVQPDGRIVVPTNQVLSPAGKQVTFPGRPVDIALLPDGVTLVVKNMQGLEFINSRSGEVTSRLACPVALSAVGILIHKNAVYVSDCDDDIRVAQRQADGAFKWDTPIRIKKPAKGAAYPTGLAALSDTELVVCANRNNTVQRIDLAAAKGEKSPATFKVTEEIPTGVAPFQVCVVGPDRMIVSNWGGDMPRDGDPRANSSGTNVRVDSRGIANHGSVSVLGRAGNHWNHLKTIEVGLHPSGLALSADRRFVFVANACSDSVSVIDVAQEKVVETISCRAEGRLPFGSGTNALALSPDGATLYVANGTNNCIGVVRLGRTLSSHQAAPLTSSLVGLIPTGWYPGGIVVTPDGKNLCVANVKGHGALSQPRPIEKGKVSRDHLGSVSLIPVPDTEALAKHTRTVNENNRLAYSLAGLEKPRPDAKPLPVPLRHGEPSLIEHVIYVIKENRTYDQVFGDIKEGNGDPNLTIFGEEVTPNQHALVRQFTLFDNFYCSGVLSADGHQWCNEAYVTDYLERAFGKFVRSYPYEGSDPLAYAPSGFLWDNVLARKKTFANFGEFTRSAYSQQVKWSDMYAQYKSGANTIKITATANVEALAPYTNNNYPGFSLVTPDVYRAKIFIDALKDFEKKGAMPNLTYLFLPCDHTSGTRPNAPTPRASVADNDLALGQVVEAVSKSKFWAKTCILVVEDDPQNGFDHVDAHRTVALAISPYTKRKNVDSTCYNQTSMVKTIELMLGLPPMNQLDLSATPMRNCFNETPDLTPCVCVPNRIPLDELNPDTSKLKGQALHWAEKSIAMDLSEADLCDEDTLNRILWHAVRGVDAPYPERFAGARKTDDDDDDD